MLKEFKKAMAVVVVFSMFLSLFTGCNRAIVDTTWKYDRAIIDIGNGTFIEGKVSSWTDYDGSDQIQVTIEGKTYLVHSSDIILIAD